MSYIGPTARFATEICELFGIKDARRIDIRLDVDDVVTVRAECYVRDEQGQRLIDIVKRYNMVPKPETIDVTTLGRSSRHYSAVDAVGGDGCKASVESVRKS